MSRTSADSLARSLCSGRAGAAEPIGALCALWKSRFTQCGKPRHRTEGSFTNGPFLFPPTDALFDGLRALFVDPAFEGRGIGRALHDAMVSWLFERGSEPLWLTTEPNTRAEQFYSTAGWRRAGIEANGELRFELTYGSDR